MMTPYRLRYILIEVHTRVRYSFKCLSMKLSPSVDTCSVLDIHRAAKCIALYLDSTRAFLDRWTGTVFEGIASSVRSNKGATYTKTLGR